MFSRFDRIPACDRRTDRRIDILPRHSSRYAYASRGKMFKSMFTYFDRIHERDRHPNRETSHDRIGQAAFMHSIARQSLPCPIMKTETVGCMSGTSALRQTFAPVSAASASASGSVNNIGLQRSFNDASDGAARWTPTLDAVVEWHSGGFR